MATPAKEEVISTAIHVHPHRPHTRTVVAIKRNGEAYILVDDELDEDHQLKATTATWVRLPNVPASSQE